MWINFIITALQIVLVLLCAFMVLIILMQRSKQEGLGAAFGAGMTESVFGADTSNVLSRLTVWCVVLFFGITLTLTSLYAHRAAPSSGVQKALTALAATSPLTPVLANTNHISTNTLSSENNSPNLSTNVLRDSTNQP